MALTDLEADGLVNAALVITRALGFTVAVAVVDEYGAPLCVQRSHPSPPTVDLAIAKAYTSVVTGQRTIDLQDWQQAWPVLVAQLGELGPYPMIVDFGGCPVIKDGQVIGGMGISGARGEEDQRICEEVLQQSGFGPMPGPHVPMTT